MKWTSPTNLQLHGRFPEHLPNIKGVQFYNSDYGICVMGGSDSLVAWDPSHFHGTSLQEYLPTSNMVSQFYQVGLACVTPNRVPGLWKKYAEKQAGNIGGGQGWGSFWWWRSIWGWRLKKGIFLVYTRSFLYVLSLSQNPKKKCSNQYRIGK